MSAPMPVYSTAKLNKKILPQPQRFIDTMGKRMRITKTPLTTKQLINGKTDAIYQRLQL